MNSLSKKPHTWEKTFSIGIDVHSRTYCVAVVVEAIASGRPQQYLNN